MDCSGVCENAHIGQIGYQELPQTSTKSGIAVDSSKNQSAAKQKQVEKRAVMTNHREKVALIALAAVVTIVALVELGMALPLLFRRSSSAPASGAQPVVYGSQYPRFLVLGDWGRDGEFNQSKVAAAMALKAESLHPDFVISTGDNFYEAGIVSPEDPQFDTSFSSVYHQPSLQVPWFAVLGNHDYGEVQGNTPKTPEKRRCGGSSKGGCYYSPLHQLDVRLARRDPRWNCRRSFSLQLAGGRVQLFFIDTTPIIDRYQKKSWAGARGGVLQQSWEDQVRELDAQLLRSEAEWKLVVGHHPIRTNHIQSEGWKEMEERVEPLLIKHGVQAYFCGHDHNLQYIYNKGRRYHHIVSGAGSQTYDEFFGNKDAPFQYGANGFVAVSMRAESMTVEYLGLNSPDPLFTVEIPKVF